MGWGLYDGFVVVETPDAIGIGPEARGDVEAWLPKSQLKHISYANGGDTYEVVKGKRIEAVEIPPWLAESIGLEYES